MLEGRKEASRDGAKDVGGARSRYVHALGVGGARAAERAWFDGKWEGLAGGQVGGPGWMLVEGLAVGQVSLA